MTLIAKGVRFWMTVLCIEAGIVALSMTTIPKAWNWVNLLAAPFLFPGFVIGFFVEEGISFIRGSSYEWLEWVPLIVGFVANTAFLALVLAFAIHIYKEVRPMFRLKDLR